MPHDFHWRMKILKGLSILWPQILQHFRNSTPKSNMRIRKKGIDLSLLPQIIIRPFPPSYPCCVYKYSKPSCPRVVQVLIFYSHPSLFPEPSSEHSFPQLPNECLYLIVGTLHGDFPALRILLHVIQSFFKAAVPVLPHFRRILWCSKSTNIGRLSQSRPWPLSGSSLLNRSHRPFAACYNMADDIDYSGFDQEMVPLVGSKLRIIRLEYEFSVSEYDFVKVLTPIFSLAK